MDILSTLPAANFTLPWMPSLPSIRNMSQIAPLPAIPFLSLITAASLSAADNDHCEVEPMTFDYIIVGAGSAGCVLAARLSENPATTVLLIEAGGDPLPIAGVPGFAPLLQQTEMDWKFLSEPQTKTGQSFTGNRVAYPQGKGLGGTSFLTFNVYHRGNPQDYNDWAAQGNAGWSYNEVLPYFVKSEGTVIPEFVNAPYRGKGGPIKTSWTEKSGIASAFLQASSAAGHPIIADYNNATTPVGVGYGQQTVFAGQRQSTYESYLKPALTRPNLSVWRNKYVKRILVKQNWGQFVANGVQYVPTNNIDCNGYALANKEVIISAGVFQSPKILQLSGIGKPEDLSPFKKIKQLKDLPVGRGLRDHVMLNLPFTYSVPPPDPLNPATPSIADLLKMLVYPPTSTIVDGQLHLKTGVTPTRVQADIQIQLAIVGIQGINLLPTSQHYKQLEAAMTYGAAPTKPLVVFNVIALNTKSKGTVKISSETEALAAPLIDPQLLSDPSDAATLLAGLKKALEIAASSPLNTTFNFKPAEQPVPDCQAYHFLSDDYLRCIIAHRADTGHHPSSTCRMGQSEADSVVDHNLRVHGFTNLRVVDASVFPAPVSGNSNAATIMIAEKIADAIVKWIELGSIPQLSKWITPAGAVVQTSQCDFCVCQNSENYPPSPVAETVGLDHPLPVHDQSPALLLAAEAPVVLSTGPQAQAMPAVPKVQPRPAAPCIIYAVSSSPCTIADKCCTVPSATVSSPNLRCGAPAYSGCICNHATNDCVTNADCCSNNCVKSGVTSTCPSGTCCQAGGAGTICYMGNDATCALGSTCTNVGLAGGNGVCQ